MASLKTHSILKYVWACCDPCQRIQSGPKRFRVSFGADKVVSNKRVLLDTTYVENNSIFRIVNKATKFYKVSSGFEYKTDLEYVCGVLATKIYRNLESNRSGSGNFLQRIIYRLWTIMQWWSISNSNWIPHFFRSGQALSLASPQ